MQISKSSGYKVLNFGYKLDSLFHWYILVSQGLMNDLFNFFFFLVVVFLIHFIIVSD